MISGLKAISQLHKEIVDKKNAISKRLNQLNIPTIPDSLDYQNNNLTLEKIFNMIPEEQKLKKSLQISKFNNDANERLKHYSGQYQVVKKAADRVQQLKPEARDIYYLFSDLNLPKINDQFKKVKSESKIQLSSYDIVNIEQNQVKQQKKQGIFPRYSPIFGKDQKHSGLTSTKATKFQRNMISQDYIYSIKQSSKGEEILPPNQYLKDDDLLINVCIYDAVNREKQHEFIFLGDMKLLQLKKQIYCVVEAISQTQNSNNNQKKVTSKSTSKNDFRNQTSFFMFQQNLYYHGTHQSQQELDNLIKMVKLSYQTDFFKYSMNSVELKSLRIVFGRPYLYRHLGGCDHMIVFKDIRLFNKNSIQPASKKKYPLMVFQSKMKRKKCEGCEHKYAILACIGDKLKNGQTSYLCKQCHQNIHNAVTNSKNAYMKVIPYLHE